MFVRSRIDKPLVFRKGGRAWVLKPHAITLIDDPKVTATEIKGCYGSRVDVISNEGTYVSHSTPRQVVQNVVKSKVEAPVKKAEVSKPKKVDEKSLDDLLDEVNKELGEMKVDNKEVDTAKNSSASEDATTGTTNDVVLQDKDATVSDLNVLDDGDNKEAETKTEKTKSTRTRRAVSKKTTAKKTTRRSTKKATKK